jgi:hypothetical protein
MDYLIACCGIGSIRVVLSEPVTPYFVETIGFRPLVFGLLSQSVLDLYEPYILVLLCVLLCLVL